MIIGLIITILEKKPIESGLIGCPQNDLFNSADKLLLTKNQLIMSQMTFLVKAESAFEENEILGKRKKLPRILIQIIFLSSADGYISVNGEGKKFIGKGLFWSREFDFYEDEAKSNKIVIGIHRDDKDLGNGMVGPIIECAWLVGTENSVKELQLIEHH